METSNHSIIFTGLDGANPLAFLAALGAFRSLDELAGFGDNPKLSWSNDGAAWRPVLWQRAAIDKKELVNRLHGHLLGMADHPALTFSDNLRIAATRHSSLAHQAVTHWLNGEDAVSHQFFAAFGCEGILTETGSVEDTALRTMSGAGHQHFVKFMNDLAKDTTREQLTEALFGPWRYSDPGPSLRFDPMDDRRHALRWKNPSQDAIKTVRGANRLAVEGIPFLYAAPVRGKLETCGFTGHNSRNTFWSWPVWERPVGLDTCRSLLSFRDLQTPVPEDNAAVREKTARMGIAAVFRSQRITMGKYRNFTPSRQIA